jgi:hypothetical protein
MFQEHRASRERRPYNPKNDGPATTWREGTSDKASPSNTAFPATEQSHVRMTRFFSGRRSLDHDDFGLTQSKIMNGDLFQSFRTE